MKWKDKLLEQLVDNLGSDTAWRTYIDKINNKQPEIAIHLAVFSDTILQDLLAGKKKVESRFSVNKISPHGKIRTGDLVLVKKSGGPIVAAFIARNITSFSNLTPSKIIAIRKEHEKKLALSAADDFWNEKLKSKFATLFDIEKLRVICPVQIEKKDRLGWVILQERFKKELFE
ncbi:MAG TPA: hypothetical protein VHD83_21900 [Puia sp.]|nr:hypothetical protein [Puia sp.]